MCTGHGFFVCRRDLMKDLASNQQSNSKNKPEGAAEWLISDVLSSNAVLFHDERNTAYIAYLGDGSKVDKIDSTAFKQWLHHYYWSKRQKPLPRDVDNQVINTLESHARFEGKRHDLGVRHVKNTQGLWYDLGDGSAVHVTPGSWQIVNNPPILFRHFQHQLPQVHPVKDEDATVEHLCNFINARDDDDCLLFIVNIVTAFIPGFPHPLLILHGPQGAGKTTPMRLMKKLIDPSAMQDSSLPSSIAEFIQIADHHAFLFFDNLSGLSVKMSDALARCSTGGGFSKRKLYTNDDDIVYQVQRPVALNGINQVAFKPDLLDRSILIELQRITQEARIPEEVFWEGFEDDKPRILGAIFNVLARALAIYPSINLEKAPRMADFTRWSCAITEAMGRPYEDFLGAYQRNIDRQNDEALNASPVAKALIAFMEDRGQPWEGTASELLTYLNKKGFDLNLTGSEFWPKDPSNLGKRLNDVHTNLSAIGIDVVHTRTNTGRFITITQVIDDPLDDEPEEQEESKDKSTEETPKSMPEQTKLIKSDGHGDSVTPVTPNS